MAGPTSNTTINPSTCMATDAAFRAWGSIVSAALATAGWVQTSDTGQINWTTVTKPGSASAAAGYEIWRLNDSLQSTAPIYIKIEYGTAAQTSTPGMWTTAGTGSDGAGNLTSVAGSGTSVTTRQTLHVANSIDQWPNANTPIEVNGDGSSLIIAMFPNTGALAGMSFALERFRNWDGTANGDGFIVTYGANGTNGTIQKTQTVYFTTTVAQPAQLSVTPGPCIGIAGSSGSCVVGNTLYPLPVLPGWGFKVQAPLVMLLLVARGDLVAGNSFTITHYGVAHTFHALGAGATTSGFATLGNNAGFTFVYRMD